MLHDDIMAHGRIYIIPAYATAKGVNVYFLRVAMVSEYMTSADVQVTFEAIRQSASHVLKTSTARAEDKDDKYMPMINNDACPADFKNQADEQALVEKKMTNGETRMDKKLANGEAWPDKELANGEARVGKLANGEAQLGD